MNLEGVVKEKIKDISDKLIIMARKIEFIFSKVVITSIKDAILYEDQQYINKIYIFCCICVLKYVLRVVYV